MPPEPDAQNRSYNGENSWEEYPKDDLIDEKLPFVVCDSTDEGAMLITSYVRLKNWTLA
jgi:hypothetical protein